MRSTLCHASAEHRGWLGWGVLVAGILGGMLGCGGPSGSRPHLLVITIDTLRADHVSGYGYDRATTPNLDRVMSDGVAFMAASTPTPTTGPAHATLFTATYPRTHRVLKNGLTLDEARPTLAEVLRARGYRTGAVVSAFPLARRFGLARGFEQYDDTFDPDEASIDNPEWEGMRLDEAFDRRAAATTDRALSWIESVRRTPSWFLWVHYYDVHAPYDPPPRFAKLFGQRGEQDPLARAIRAYDAETRYVDENVGRLLARVDTLFSPRAVLVVVATDHGEGLMDHGWMEHGVNLYEELVRVLLAIRWPDRVPAGLRSDTPVGLVDVAPTVLALLGLPASMAAAEGRDLSPLLRGEPWDDGRPMFFERRLYAARDATRVPAVGPMHAVREGRWKYVSAPEQGIEELFDLESDPGETRNLRHAEPATATRLAALLSEWRRTGGGAAASAAPVSPDDAARLRALGYVE